MIRLRSLLDVPPARPHRSSEALGILRRGLGRPARLPPLPDGAWTAAEIVERLALQYELMVTSTARPAGHPSPSRPRGVHVAGPFGLFVWPEAFRPGPPPRVPHPSGSWHFSPPVTDFKTPLGSLTVRRIRNTYLTMSLGLEQRAGMREARRRSAALRETLDDVSWWFPIWDSSWTRRRIFDHERDWWQ